MSEPLLFVCVREPIASKRDGAATRFFSIESPAGPVFMAFGSHQLAAAVAVLYGVAANVFLVPETQLTPELVGSLSQHRVVIFHTAADYDGATGNEPGFPWPDRTVLYDFAAALTRGCVQ